MKYYFAEREDSTHYDGPYESLEEAREACESDDPELDVYWIGEEHQHIINPGGSNIIDNIAQDLDDETYEDAGESWLENIKNTDELGDELDEVIRTFLESKGIPTSVVVIKNQKQYSKEKTHAQ